MPIPPTRHELLGNLMARRNELDGAIRELQAAVRIRSDFHRAHLDLGSALARKGNKKSAAEHLRLAAKSSDPRIRQVANQLLGEVGK